MTQHRAVLNEEQIETIQKLVLGEAEETRDLGYRFSLLQIDHSLQLALGTEVPKLKAVGVGSQVSEDGGDIRTIFRFTREGDTLKDAPEVFSIRPEAAKAFAGDIFRVVFKTEAIAEILKEQRAE